MEFLTRPVTELFLFLDVFFAWGFKNDDSFGVGWHGVANVVDSMTFNSKWALFTFAPEGYGLRINSFLARCWMRSCSVMW